jgi:hypothetical protein
MAFYSNGLKNIDNQGIVDLRLYTSTSLPQSALAGYLAYVSDQQSLTVNTGDASVINGVSQLWKTFATLPADYKNEVILEQGVVGGGYNSSVGGGGWNYMSRTLFSSDATIQLQTTLPFSLAYGGEHSTWQYAYFHSGSATGAAKQDWATFTVASIANRTTISGGLGASLNPGTKGQNTIGVLTQATDSVSLNFSTDTWTNFNYNPPVALQYGSFNDVYGYGMSFTAGNVYKLNWSNSTWSATNSRVANGSYNSGATPKSLNTKWNKWYQGGTGATVDIYSTVTDTFTSNPHSPPGSFQEQGTMMGQDWGYWVGYVGGFTGTGYKTDYSLDTTIASSRTALQYSGSSSSGTSGPI